MTTMTRKATKPAKTVRIDNVTGRDGKPSDYSAEIVVGERITIRGTKTVGYRKTGVWVLNYTAMAASRQGRLTREQIVSGDYMTREQINDWFMALPVATRNDMAGLVEGKELAVLGDAIEESGGNRLWATHLAAYEAQEPITGPTEQTYRVGDRAEFDSYNLFYLGTIVSITEKTVTIDTERSYESKTRRLSIYDFCWRNYDGIEKKVKNNREWLD